MALAVARSWVASARDRAGAIAAVTKRDRLLIPATERLRMDWVIDKLVMTPSVRANGLGYAEPTRLARGIEVLKQGFQLATPPTVAQVFDDRFLPPVADRTPTRPRVPPNCDLTLGLTCIDKSEPGVTVWTMPGDERFATSTARRPATIPSSMHSSVCSSSTWS